MPESNVPENPGFWWRFVHLDPALLRAFIVAAFLLAGGLGLSFATDLPDNLITFISAALMLIQGLWTRSSVTANARVLVRVPDPVNRPGVVVPGEAVTTASDARILSAASDTPRY